MIQFKGDNCLMNKNSLKSMDIHRDIMHSSIEILWAQITDH